jgi:hypothetical protein
VSKLVSSGTRTSLLAQVEESARLSADNFDEMSAALTVLDGVDTTATSARIRDRA